MVIKFNVRYIISHIFVGVEKQILFNVNCKPQGIVYHCVGIKVNI